MSSNYINTSSVQHSTNDLWAHVFNDPAFKDQDFDKSKILKISEKILKLDNGRETLTKRIMEFEGLLKDKAAWSSLILNEVKKTRYDLIQLPQDLRRTDHELLTEFALLNEEDESHLLFLARKGEFAKVDSLKRQCSKSYGQQKFTHHTSSWPAYDKSLVSFTVEGKPGYFNASICPFTDLSGCNRRVILSEAPKDVGTETTVRSHFFEIISQNNVGIILCLANPEAGAGYSPYWPEDEVTLSFGNFKISTKEKKVLATSKLYEDQQLIQRTLIINDGSKERECIHLHMKNWIDMEACDANVLATLIIHVNNLLKDAPESTQALTHCLIGLGRTGVVATLLAVCGAIVDQKYDGVETKKLELKINDCLLRLRKDVRMGLVMKPDQYISIYRVLKKVFPIFNELNFDEESSSKVNKNNPKDEI